MNSEDRRHRPVRRRAPARRLLAIIAAGLVPFLAACGPSTLEIYDRFEADLVEELRSEWNATPTGGCPEVEVWSVLHKNSYDWLTEDERRELPNDPVERVLRARSG